MEKGKARRFGIREHIPLDQGLFVEVRRINTMQIVNQEDNIRMLKTLCKGFIRIWIDNYLSRICPRRNVILWCLYKHHKKNHQT